MGSNISKPAEREEFQNDSASGEQLGKVGFR